MFTITYVYYHICLLSHLFTITVITTFYGVIIFVASYIVLRIEDKTLRNLNLCKICLFIRCVG